MRILYLGQLRQGSTCFQRMRALEKLGHQVKGINTSDEPTAGFPVRNLAQISRRLGWPLDLKGVNERLIEFARRFSPNVVWVDKGLFIRPQTLLRVKSILTAVRLVHYNPDDPFGHLGKRGWRKFIAAIPAYDIHFVPRRENVTEYNSHGAQRVIQNIPTRGFDPEIHHPYGETNDLKSAFAADVGFLGAFEIERAKSLRRLAEADCSIRLMCDWPAKHWHKNFFRAPQCVIGTEYAKAIGSFKIGLGFLRKINRDQHTSRSIEIPACGTFMLAERTEEHSMLFDEGKEAEFFSSDEELIDKVRFYLANDSARESIALAGRERCLRSGYDYPSRMCQMLAQVLEGQS